MLGRQSMAIKLKEEVQIIKPIANNKENFVNQEKISNQIQNNNMSIGRVYASSKGKRYYIEGICDGNISDKNKVYYKDESGAIASGKSKANGCN